MVLSIGFRSSVSFPPAIQATGLLTLTPAGLPPAEHASLSWTRGLSRRSSGNPTYHSLTVRAANPRAARYRQVDDMRGIEFGDSSHSTLQNNSSPIGVELSHGRIHSRAGRRDNRFA